jgi:hypothetical protein
LPQLDPVNVSARFLLPPDSPWSDVTDELAGEGAPLTLARSDGVGALQIAEAKYLFGSTSDANSGRLLSLLREFGESAVLGQPTDMHVEAGPPIVAAASFIGDAFVRVWYLSDGANIALATYTCALENAAQSGEVAECEAIVRTVRFR